MRETRTFPSLVQAPVLSVSQPFYASLFYFIGRIFSCWHWKMSRPITRGKESYRVCLRCGMHRAFDVEGWRSTGRFYAPSVDRETRG
ncbi:MAG TPA: hypothetical protein VJP89_16420 [Pyrinomonadaceae bacterium]|nr:hypothetical protein [Pyrinomonadaceae bacterium]